LSMKAMILSEFGPSDKLKFGELADPKPNGNEVLVRLEAASINHVDIWVRKGIPAYPVRLPHVLGCDGAGVVESTGPEAEGVSPGDRVLIIPGISCGTCSYCLQGKDNQCDSFSIVGTKQLGTYAELVVVPDQNVFPIPESLSFEKASAFPLAYLTAWHMLIGKARLQPKELVLIVGASSGVSIAAIQITKWRGAKVLAITSGEHKIEKIKNAGADEVFLQKAGEDFYKWVLKQTNGQGVEVVFEHVGPATWEKSFKSLKRAGRLVTCGATTGPTVPLDLRYLFSRELTLMGARLGTHKEFLELAELVSEGKINPVIDKVFPLNQAAEAHAYIESKKQVGKVLLKHH